MPQTRILYTLLDVKTLLSKIHKVPLEQVKQVNVFDDLLLQYDCCESTIEIKNDTFIIQVDK